MHPINESIFKSYDIRGIYPTEINEEAAFYIGKAFARMIGGGKVIVGRDMRLGSPDLHKGLLNGLIEEGIEVHDIGLVPIDSVYFAVGKYGYNGGVMITASHNPKEYAGLKLVGKGIKWIRGKDILNFLTTYNLQPITDNLQLTTGQVIKKEILPEHVNHILSFADIPKLKPLKIVVDAGNGMAGKTIPLIFECLPLTLVPLFFELDGNFPNHPSNPLELESRIAISKKVVEEKANLGALFDGDSDRVFFFDENGNFIRGDVTMLVIAKEILKKNPGAGVAYTLNCTKAVPEKIKEMGGIPLRAPVGYVNVTTIARQAGGVMGGELTGHYSYRDNFYADSGYISLMIVLQTLSESGKKMSELVKEFNLYYPSEEINFRVPKEKIPSVIAAIKEKYKDGKQDELDGLTVEYKDWWLLIRPSNTEPLLRLNVEGNTKEILEEKTDELSKFIHNNQ